MQPEATPLRRGILRHLVITVSCLACGDSDELLVSDLTRLPPLPRPCRRCGGSVVAMSAVVRRTFAPLDPDDLADLRPRRGRPSKRRQEPAA